MRLIPTQSVPTLYHFTVVLYKVSCYCSLSMFIWFMQAYCVAFTVLFYCFRIYCDGFLSYHLEVLRVLGSCTHSTQLNLLIASCLQQYLDGPLSLTIQSLQKSHLEAMRAQGVDVRRHIIDTGEFLY